MALPHNLVDSGGASGGASAPDDDDGVEPGSLLLPEKDDEDPDPGPDPDPDPEPEVMHGVPGGGPSVDDIQSEDDPTDDMGNSGMGSGTSRSGDNSGSGGNSGSGVDDGVGGDPPDVSPDVAPGPETTPEPSSPEPTITGVVSQGQGGGSGIALLAAGGALVLGAVAALGGD